MVTPIPFFCFFFFIIADAWALQEPPIYYDRTNVLQNEISQQDSACWEEGGVCTSLANCPTGHILNLPALGDLCGESGTSVCCTPLAPTQKEVSQVATCNEKQAFCTWDSLCPSESRVGGPQLCGGQEDVSCCSTGQAKKRSVGLPGFFTAPAIPRPYSQRGLFKLRAFGDVPTSPNQLGAGGAAGEGGAGKAASKLTINAVSISKKNARAQQDDANEEPGSDAENPAVGPVNLASFGAAEKHRGHTITEENCLEKGGLCIQREHCSPEDQLGPHDLCGFQNFVACCKASKLTKPQPSN